MNLFDLPIISVVISIIITWCFLSIICSYINESIVQLKAERGRYMKKYLLQQLHDFSNGISWGNILYNHGTIDMLSRTVGHPANDIDPNTFAKTILML